jgi:Flp pilus assembly protein TadG
MWFKQRSVSTISRAVQSARRQEEGQDIVEYALILPFLLLLTFMIIEGGWLIFRYNTVANAAREGARAGIIPVSAACNQTCIQDRVTAAANALAIGLNPARLTIQPPVFTAATVQVTVNYNADLITGFVIQAMGGTTSIPLSATSTMQRE